MERKETRTIGRACIERLPDNYRTVLLLRDIEELSTQEVSGVIDRIHDARLAVPPTRSVLVAVTGIDGCGKEFVGKGDSQAAVTVTDSADSRARY